MFNYLSEKDVKYSSFMFQLSKCFILQSFYKSGRVSASADCKKYLHLFPSLVNRTFTAPQHLLHLLALTFTTVFDTDRIQIDNPQPKTF